MTRSEDPQQIRSAGVDRDHGQEGGSGRRSPLRSWTASIRVSLRSPGTVLAGQDSYRFRVCGTGEVKTADAVAVIPLYGSPEEIAQYTEGS